ncbi:DJ-1/PfpI family protein [Muricauda oceani]|nr:DJ-1/PfpI family protein [Allomuricauda oceani]MBW8244955.1 DJ-1/PfpI family protein [Allomuricauda oceani]
MKQLARLVICFISVTTMAQSTKESNTEYICPPCNSECDNVTHDAPGVCEHCNMPLIQKGTSKTIAFYLQDGVEVLDFAGPMEVFSYAGYRVFTVSATKDPIKSQGILTVVPDYSIKDAPKADILAFFGGNSQAASQNEEVIAWVKKQEDIEYHFSVCTGAFVLAEAGILNGKVATTFHNALSDLETNYPEVDVRKNVRYVDNGEVITTAGISAGIDGALHIVAKLQGINAAKRTAYYMEYDNWNMGNGLLLSESNPYANTKQEGFFQDFEGVYQYKNDTTFKLRYNKHQGNLEVEIDHLFYPIYHENDDVFSDVDSEYVYFLRNASGAITGYRLEQNGKTFDKLD